MLKLWIRVGMLAACLAAVVYAQMYLSKLAGHGNYDDSNLMSRPLEVETQALNAEGEQTKRSF